MFLTFRSPKALAFPLGGHSRTQESQDTIVAFCISNNDDASSDRPNGDEPILLIGMSLVVDLQVVNAGLEKLGNFIEG
jgi:hypothetical protein